METIILKFKSIEEEIPQIIIEMFELEKIIKE